MSSTDLLGVALGSCVMTVMGIVVRRGGLDLSGAKVRVLKDMSTAPVARISLLEVTVTLPKGLRCSPADRAKLERAAHACPVKNSLHPDVNVRLRFAG